MVNKPAELGSDMQAARAVVNMRLSELLQGGPVRLLEAMRYAVLGEGKRLRPILCLWTHEMLRPGATDVPLDVACALEFVHTYSLIHDDLPCMDDDDLRRGRPTCHVRYGEAVALLAGDALLNLAYETLLSAPWSHPERALRAARTLADAASHRQLVGGQVLDLEAEGKEACAHDLEAIHLAKTAALIRASLLLGGHAASASEETLQTLDEIGRHLGLAFQITDDILDVVGDNEALGKTAGKDRDAGKMTYPALYGVEASRQHAQDHIMTALRLLQGWPEAERLKGLARYFVQRLR